jgi:SAM-dependent methyltransferase
MGIPSKIRGPIDDPCGYDAIRAAIARKSTLKAIYREFYGYYRDCLQRCPETGAVVEIGAGCGFASEMVPELIATDLIPYPTVDIVLDATQLPFPSRSVRCFLMLNTFHHIADCGRFLEEAARCLVPGGRILIIDQHRGFISTPLLRHFHHEHYDDRAVEWRFDSTGPLSGANGALAWIVFVRDREKFERSRPELRIVRYQPIVPLRYWLSGGLRRWNLLPGFLDYASRALERGLLLLAPDFGSFVVIELLRARLPHDAGEAIAARRGILTQILNGHQRGQ